MIDLLEGGVFPLPLLSDLVLERIQPRLRILEGGVFPLPLLSDVGRLADEHGGVLLKGEYSPFLC